VEGKDSQKKPASRFRPRKKVKELIFLHNGSSRRRNILLDNHPEVELFRIEGLEFFLGREAVRNCESVRTKYVQNHIS
jgi:hypothetical protein